MATKNSGEKSASEFFKQNRRYWSKEPITFNGNRVFQRNDLIDPNKITTWRQNGKIIQGTNLERMSTGRSPIGADGNPINLHHMTQTQKGPIAEMTQSFHQTNHSVIHINGGNLPSGINRTQFDQWRSNYWQTRAANWGK